MRRLFALGLALAPLWACASSRPTPTPAPQAPPAAPSANRDPRGPADVADYVARLESAERVADLQVDSVIERLALAPDARVCDLGCGPGVFALAFARALPRGVVYAVDVEPAQLDRLRQHMLELGVENVVPVLASPSTPHLASASVDLIFIGDTYHHLQDRVAYLQRLARVLAPGGRLAILEYKPGELPVGPPPDHKLPAGVMRRELEEAGWERIAEYDTHRYHDFEIWRRRGV